MLVDFVVPDIERWICTAGRHFCCLISILFLLSNMHNLLVTGGSSLCRTLYPNLRLAISIIEVMFSTFSSFLFSRAMFLFVTYWSALFWIFCNLFICSLLAPLPYNRKPYCI